MINVTNDIIKFCSDKKEIVNFIKQRYGSRISYNSSKILLKKILRNERNITIKNIKSKKTLRRYNSKDFEKVKNFDKKKDDIENYMFDNEIIIELREKLLQYIEPFLKNLDYVDDEDVIEKKRIKGIDYYKVDKNTEYEKVRNLICDEDGEVMFYYDFNNPDIKSFEPYNTNLLQRYNIHIIGKPIKFDYPVKYHYYCDQCGATFTKKTYEVESTKNKVICRGSYLSENSKGELVNKKCNLSLYPDKKMSRVKDAYMYSITYSRENGNKEIVNAFSFEYYESGYYEVVMFRLKEPFKIESYQIIDTLPIKPNKFILPVQDYKENYIITLQKSIDLFIKTQANMEIYGLLPIKFALILQLLTNILEWPLQYNIQVVGQASSGKSTVLKYYGIMLYNKDNIITSGQSISLPALRGTPYSIKLGNSSMSLVSIGYLGEFKSIHIDEAGENKDLVNDLKAFLYETNYSYNKAGATNIEYKRTAHVNITQNLNSTHLSMYRNSIRKAYNELNIQINNNEKKEWEESWDLHQPLFKYDNPYLLKVVKDKRESYQLAEIFWIDGYDNALHERFPFYFYLENNNNDKNINKIIMNNVINKPVLENLKLVKYLRNEDLTNFMESLKVYDTGADVSQLIEIDKILSEYGVTADSRSKIFYYKIVILSRIINRRKIIIDQDYDFLRYMIEKLNCKISVSDTAEYKINGAPNLNILDKFEKDIDNSEEIINPQSLNNNLNKKQNNINNTSFGLPDNEFE